MKNIKFIASTSELFGKIIDKKFLMKIVIYPRLLSCEIIFILITSI